MSSAGVDPLYFVKSEVNAAICQDIIERIMLPYAGMLTGDAVSIFQQDLAPAHNAKSTKAWPKNHGSTAPDWPANPPDPNPIKNPWGIVRRKVRDSRPNNTDEPKITTKSNLGLHNTPAAPKADSPQATPHRYSNQCKRGPNQVLSAYT